MVPTFSICHPTRRLPDGWRAAAQAWADLADHPEDVEYIVAVDEGAISCLTTPWEALRKIPRLSFVKNTGRECSTEAYNVAAAASCGKVVAMGSDDLFPCQHWDSLLLECLGRRNPLAEDMVLWVGTGSPRDGELISHPIISRHWYEKRGYFLYPEYESMLADDDITMEAFRDNVVVDCRHVAFEHRHHSLGKSQDDEVYRSESRAESYELGKKVFEKRWGRQQ